jgi:transcriptional regulator with XRE-family HTH domain
MQNDDPLALGPALRLLRARRRLRQYQVAERSGITKAMLSSYENGGTKPSLQTLMALLGGLESDLSELQQALEMISGGRAPEEESEPAPTEDPQNGTVIEVRVPKLDEVLPLLERIAAALEGIPRHSILGKDVSAGAIPEAARRRSST